MVEKELIEQLRAKRLLIEPSKEGLSRHGAEWCSIQRNGNYVRAWFGSWKDEEQSGYWDNYSLLPDAGAIGACFEARGEEEQKARLEFQQEVCKEAEAIWATGKPGLKHPYFTDKQIAEPYGTRIAMNAKGYPVLLVPMRDTFGKLWNLQRIYGQKMSAGNKFFLKGGLKQGLFHCLLDPMQRRFILCEGFATGAAIQEAVGLDANVIVCFDAGNLYAVAENLKTHFSYERFLVCGDDDAWTEGNPGKTKAKLTAMFLGCEMILPRFRDQEGRPTDFNDLKCREGVEEVRRQITPYLDGTATAKSEEADPMLDAVSSLPPVGPFAERDWNAEMVVPTIDVAQPGAFVQGGIDQLAAMPAFAESPGAGGEEESHTENEEKTGKSQDKKKSLTPGENRVVMTILESLSGNILKWHKDLFEYEPSTGIWGHLNPEQALDKYYRLINGMTSGRWKHKDLISGYNRLLRLIPTAPHNPFAPNRYCVGFKNGALHLEPGAGGTWVPKLKAHQRENLLIQGHAFNYTKDVPYNEEFERAVPRVLGDSPDAMQAYFQVLGACLLPGAFRKLVFFVGPPKSGKSTLIMFAWHLVDQRFRCSVDPTEMKGFATESLAGKLLNADPDITLNRPLTDSVLKKIEDGIEIRIQRKGIADLMAPIPGMHLFGGNAMPMTRDGVDPYGRRMMIFKCENYQAPEDHNKQYVAEVTAQNPQGILRRAIEGLEQLCQSGGHFTVSQGSKKQMEEWKSDNSDVVEQFLQDLREGALHLDEQLNQEAAGYLDRFPTTRFWELFFLWQDKNVRNWDRIGKHALFRRMRQLNFHTLGDGAQRYFSGIGGKSAPYPGM